MADTIPKVQLFVKAAKDKDNVGGCMMCHRYFLACHVMYDEGVIDLTMTTEVPEKPSDEVRAYTNGRNYPLLVVHSGVDAQEEDISNTICSSVDAIETLLDRLNCHVMVSEKVSSSEAKAEQVFKNLYRVSTTCRLFYAPV